MASTLDVTFVDTKAWNEAYALRACNIVSAVVISYEFVLHFDDEIEYFWKKRWSPGKFLFLWSRYFSLAFVVGNAIVFANQNASVDQLQRWNSCVRFFRWQDGAAATAIIVSHLVLELRLYAMYRGVRWATIIIFSLPILESIAVGILFGLPNEAWGGNEPAPGIKMCADGDFKGKRFLVFYPTTSLIIEITLLALSVWQMWINRGTGMSHGKMIRMLIRGSVFYFLCLFWIYLMVQIFWALNIYTLNELSTSFSFCFSAVFANRLMIDLRKTYYNTTGNTTLPTATDTTHMTPNTWNAVSRSSSRGKPLSGAGWNDSIQTTACEAYEMRTFSEAAGF